MPSYYCCKPFTDNKCSRTLRILSEYDRHYLNKLNQTERFNDYKRICSSCFILIHKKKRDISTKPATDDSRNTCDETNTCDEPEAGTSSTREDALVSPDLMNMEQNELITNVNEYIIPHLTGPISPIKKKLWYRAEYSTRKSEEVIKSLQQSLMEDSTIDTSEDIEKKVKYYDALIQNLKFQYDNGDKYDKLKILSVLPLNMAYQEIRDIFGESVTQYAIQKSKECHRNKMSFSSLTSTTHRPRKSLSERTKNAIETFYEDDEISRMMPGMQDKIAITEGNKRKQLQKRLMMSSLKEAYVEFKKRYPLENVGFTKFTTMRPKHCIKLGIGNQQNVCVCTLHQNMKLMFEQSQLKLIDSNEHTFNEYKDLITFVVCHDSEQNINCYTSMCDICNINLKSLESIMLENFLRAGIDQIKYKKWNTTDRCNLDTLINDVEEFTDNFIKHLRILIPHHFISKQQSTFLKKKKESLQPGELLVQLDFAENYSFLIQDAIQGYHWANAQATIHPFVLYYRDGDVLHHTSFIIISDCNQHDSIAVHLFINKLIDFIRNMQFNAEKIIYVSDGSGAQYKNKYNFINLCYHQTDFKIKAEWHFHATSHGKSACDGVGGILKRGARRFSIANKDTIRTAEELFNWATTKWDTTMNIAFSKIEEYNQMKDILQLRYKDAVTITGTQSYHSFMPLNRCSLEVRKFSNSEEFKICDIVKTTRPK